ncbi:hypothetical protein H4R33_002375 [Dimargaris cristalligena]|nr:hypothetical protein H4R33_002375 [Dimargaris cristalligena]
MKVSPQTIVVTINLMAAGALAYLNSYSPVERRSLDLGRPFFQQPASQASLERRDTTNHPRSRAAVRMARRSADPAFPPPAQSPVNNNPIAFLQRRSPYPTMEPTPANPPKQKCRPRTMPYNPAVPGVTPPTTSTNLSTDTVAVPTTTDSAPIDTTTPMVEPTPENTEVMTTDTPTPENTEVVPTDTPTPENTEVVPTDTPTPENTEVVPTILPTPENTGAVPTILPTPDNTEIAPTETPTDSTDTRTDIDPIPTETPVDTAIMSPTEFPTEMPTEAETDTGTDSSETPTETPTDTDTDASADTETDSIEVPTETPTGTDSGEIPTETPSETPSPTAGGDFPEYTPTGASTLEGGPFKGKATFYSGGEGTHSCGNPGSSTDFTVAVNESQMGSESNGNPNCFHIVRVTYAGQSVDAMITDTCPGCDVNQLDLNESIAKHFGEKFIDDGENDIEWSLVR